MLFDTSILRAARALITPAQHEALTWLQAFPTGSAYATELPSNRPAIGRELFSMSREQWSGRRLVSRRTGRAGFVLLSITPAGRAAIVASEARIE